jgi:SAM-dependent methyltransferase
VHANSFRRVQELRKEWVPAGSSVLDVGGADVNGTYQPIFADCRYVTLDHERADVIVDGYDWPLEDESFDVVVSGQCLEHDKFFWLTLKNIARVLKPGGIFLLVVPWEAPVHRYPIDCWRFLPDSASVMGEWANMELIEQHGDAGRREGKPGLADLACAYRKRGAG